MNDNLDVSPYGRLTFGARQVIYANLNRRKADIPDELQLTR
jgi:hypothetical protein